MGRGEPVSGRESETFEPQWRGYKEAHLLNPALGGVHRMV